MIKTFEPKNFTPEETTIWSFKSRGNWATHSGKYRGNWSPYIPRNIILNYSKPGDLVLDYFCGAGTTPVEAKLLGRNCIAADINPDSVNLTKKNLEFSPPADLFQNKYFEPKVYINDARDLSFLENESIDLICSHPPYAGIIKYSENLMGDLSHCSLGDFYTEIEKVARESFRVLKNGKYCALLIGDGRKEKHILPIGLNVINIFLDAGFELRDLVIKRQHNCSTTGYWYWNSLKYNFLLIAHEYIPIFQKPPISKYKLNRNYKYIYNNSNLHTTLKKDDKYETTTVWLNTDQKEESFLRKNLMERFGSDNYYEFELNYRRKNNVEKLINNIDRIRTGLVKSKYFNQIQKIKDFEIYLETIRTVGQNILEKIEQNGYLILELQDKKMNNKLFCPGLKFINYFQNTAKLKEIVIFQDQTKTIKNKYKGYAPAHKYFFVYRKL